MGIAHHEIVFIDEIDEGFGGLRRQGELGSAVVHLADHAEPLSGAVFCGINRIRADDTGAVFLEGRCDRLAVHRMPREGGDFLLVRERGFAGGIPVGQARLHLGEDFGEAGIQRGGLIRLVGGDVFRLFDIHARRLAVFGVNEVVELERRHFSALGVVVADEFEIPRADRALVVAMGVVPNHIRARLAVLVEHKRGVIHRPGEQWQEIRAVEVFPLGLLDPGHRKNGGIKIQAVDHDIALLVGRNARAGDEEWDAHAAFARRGLACGERGVVADAFALGPFHAAVVRRE